MYYSTRDSATSATMRLHGEIGYDVLSSLFIEELNYLVADGVTDLTVRLNSIGGNVINGFAIFSELLNCPATVTTVNDGLAASTAGWLLLTGSKVQAADYSLFMLHNPSTGDPSPQAQVVLGKMRDSIITILSGRSGQTPAAVGQMMDNETWLSAQQCLALGFITEILPTEVLVALDPAVQNTLTMYQIVNSALGLGAPKMEETPEVAPVVEEVAPAEEVAAEAPATEEATPAEPATEEVVPVVETPEVVPEEVPAVEEVAPAGPAEEVPAVDNAADVSAQLAELLLQNAALTERLAIYEAKEAEAARLVVVNRAKDLVKAAIATGKVAAAAENHWLTLATENHELAKQTLDALSAPVRSTTSALNKAASLAGGSAAPAGTPSAAAQPTLRDLEKKNPREVERLYKEDRVAYNQLFFNQYGKYPVE